MHFPHLSLRAPWRILLAVAAVVVFAPAMALAPSAHALDSLPGTPTAGMLERVGTVIANAVVGATHVPPPRPSVEVLAHRCDHESTRTGGAPSCREAAYRYFRDKGLKASHAAGIVGNLWLESSGVSPKSRQYGGGPGRGIAQWTVTERWRGVVALARTRGVDPETLQVQLDYLWQEFHTTYKRSFAVLRTASNVQEATLAFQNKFEVPVGTHIGGPAFEFNAHPHAHTAERLRYAQDIRSGS